MRFLGSLAASSLLLVSHATFSSASIAYVLTFDPETAQSKHKISLNSLSPTTARMVLAQRAGVEDFHTVFGIDNDEMEAINSYGAKTSMFESKSQDRAFLLAELEPEAQSNAMLRMHAKFTIHDPPTFEATKELFQDLFQQSHPSKPMKSSYLTNKQYLRSMESPIFHITSDAQALIEMARELSKKNTAVTALLIPSGSRDSNWGQWHMPGSKDTPKRQIAHLLEETEELLSAAAAGVAHSIPSSPIVELKASNSSSNYSNTSPLRGILPSCFATEKSCNTQTRGCTGHGSCKLKYTNKDVKSGSAECWSCSCTSTKKDGLTTVWGGAACQKKDISIEFWIIALFTVGLVSAVTFAVGNLWSMGEQDLPSVIGAGVSGPTARK